MADFDRNTLRASLQAVPNNIMPPEQIEIMLSLFQMLNDTNPAIVNDTCERMFADFIIPIFNSDLDPQNKINKINEAMIQMAETAGTPIEDETETLKIALKIAWYRNAALYSLATGATIAAVQAMFPGAFLFIFDQAYSIYQYLIAKGISAADIAAKVATDPSPFAPDSPGPFAVPFAEAFLNAVSGAVSSAFFACANVAAEVGSAAIRSIPDATKLAIEAVGFAATVSLAGIVVGKVVAAGKVVLDATTGKYDRAAAEWLKRGGMKRTQDAIKAAVRATRDTAINIVEYTKDTIIAAINGFVEVTNGMRDPSRAPNRFAAAHVNAVILNWLDIYMSRLRDLPDVNIILGNLVDALSTIVYDQGEAKRNETIKAAAEKLGVNLDEINDPLTKAFWSVIIVNTLAVDKKNKLIKSVSLGFPGASYHEPKPLVETGRSVSGVDRQIFIEDPDDPYRSYYRQRGQENVGTWTEQTVADIAANNIFSSAKMNESIKDLYKNDPEFKKAMQDVGLLPIIAQQNREDQEEIVTAINTTPTKIITGNPEERKRKKEENKAQIIRSIERKLTEIQTKKIAGLKASLPQSRIEDIFHEAGPARTINEEKYRSRRQAEASRLREEAARKEEARLKAADDDMKEAIKQTEEDKTKSSSSSTKQGNKKSRYVKDPDAMIVEEVDLGGSRRRHRKSRRYKKKRSTLKRRQMKRRRTRKGKKRRHTKKR